MSVFGSDSRKNSKGPGPSQPIHTLLGKGTLWKGEIHTGPNNLRIEGTVEGSIESEGEVTVAPTGVVKGIIHAKHMIVTGRIEGNFKIKECLEIHGTGWVEGDVEVGSLVVDEGGTLQGTCTRRGEKPKAAPEPAELERPEIDKKDLPAAPHGHLPPPPPGIHEGHPGKKR